MSYIDKALSRLPILDMLSSKKTVSISYLNRLGIQAFRVWLAEKRYSLRPKSQDEDVKDYMEQLSRDGIIVIPDFLPAEDFALLENECYEALKKEERSNIRQDGPNMYTNIGSAKLGEYPAIMKALRDKRIEKFFTAAERRNVDLSKITTLLSCLIQGEDNGTTDPETNLHEDTFFNTHKAWLYISDVDLPQAPFVYVKGSNQNDRTDRINKIREYSISGNVLKSRRIPDEELAELGLEESVFKAKKNTFVLANTLGFHRRLRGVAGNERVALAYSARYNPFI